MHKFVILEKKTSDTYMFSSDDAELVTIGFFLCHDCRGNNISWYRNWALDPHEITAGGNASWLHKTDGMIELSWLYDEQDECKVYLSSQEFIHMINIWEPIDETYPDRIKLILDNTPTGNHVIIEILSPSNTSAA